MAKTLPFDIIHRIIFQGYNKQLWPIDLYNLCLVSHSFYDVATPLLWLNPHLYSIYDFYKFLQGFYIIFSSTTKKQYIKQDILKIKKLDLGFLSTYNNEFQNQYNSFSSSFSNNYSKINNPYIDNNINEYDNYYSSYSKNYNSKRIPYASELPSKLKSNFNVNENFINSKNFLIPSTNVNLPFLLKFLFEKINESLQSLILIGNPSKNILQISYNIASKNNNSFSNLNSLILLNINSTSLSKIKEILKNCTKLQHLSLRINGSKLQNISERINSPSFSNGIVFRK